MISDDHVKRYQEAYQSFYGEDIDFAEARRQLEALDEFIGFIAEMKHMPEHRGLHRRTDSSNLAEYDNKIR